MEVPSVSGRLDLSQVLLELGKRGVRELSGFDTGWAWTCWIWRQIMAESPCEMVKALGVSNIFATNSKISMDHLRCFYFWFEGSTTHGGGWCSPSRADAEGRPLWGQWSRFYPDSHGHDSGVELVWQMDTFNEMAKWPHFSLELWCFVRSWESTLVRPCRESRSNVIWWCMITWRNSDIWTLDMAEWGTRKSVWKSLSSNHPEVGIHCTALGADTLDFDDQRGDREILNFGFLGLMKNDGIFRI